MAKALRTAYLVAYNGACMLGWAYVLFLGVAALAAGKGLTSVWGAAALPLTIAQWAMCLEIVHAATGIVPSPVFTTFLQVLSRIVVLVVATSVPASQGTIGAGVAVLSWGLVEVPRYAFYLANLLGGVPFPLFFARYSLFYVLYPSGILGEIGTLRSAVHVLVAARAGATVSVLGAALPAAALTVALKVILVTYIPAGPFMYFNMVGNRKSAFAKRCGGAGREGVGCRAATPALPRPPPLVAARRSSAAAKPPPPPESGTAFPPDAKGGRSTTDAGKAAIAAALRGAGADKAAERVAREKVVSNSKMRGQPARIRR